VDDRPAVSARAVTVETVTTEGRVSVRIRITVTAEGRPAADAVLDAAPGAVLGDAAAALARLAGLAPDAVGPTVSCAGSVLDPTAPIGTPPLVDGAALGIGRPMPVHQEPGRRQLRVVAGPDAGAVLSVRPGRVTVGRSREADVRIEDPDLSRRHLLLAVGGGSMTVVDCGSANGTLVGGTAVGPSGARLEPGRQVSCGSSRLEYVEVDAAPAAVRPDGEGGLGFSRPPRVLPAAARGEIVLPAPDEHARTRFPWLLVALPLLLGGLLWAVMGGDRGYLLLLLLSPLLLAAASAGEALTGRPARRRAAAVTERRLAEAERDRDRAVRAEVARRRSGAPDPAEVLLMATGPDVRLWERRPGDPDALRVRLGTGDLPASLAVRAGPGGAASHPVLPGVALTVQLGEVGVLGISGPERRRDALARWVVGQLAALHPPGDLRLVLLAEGPEAPGWRWLRWLPHLVPDPSERCTLRVATDEVQVDARLGELSALLERRAAGHSPPGPRTVVVLGSAELRARPEVARLLADGPGAGILAVCLADSAAALPEECGAVARLVEGSADVVLDVAGAPPSTAVADGVSLRWTARLARSLAPLRDLTPLDGAAALPVTVRWTDLLGVRLETVGWAPRWPAAASTSTVLGMGTDGPVTVDLRRDGPHVLVAGTTGAGKSELLQTLVAGLAAGNRPDALTFLLVDYKGGAAFGACSALPHTVGLVTDLDPHLTRRALSSLRAELRRREHALATVGARDLEEYERRRAADPHLPPLARLVLVVDEFATLVAELPDFVDGLVDLARRGRSLGVHLVLATQRPAGVVSPEIRANTALRIGLRMTDDADSRDVLDAADAARIPQACPGRALVRLSDGRLTALQVARIGGTGRRAAAGTTVRPLSWERAGDPPPEAAEPAAVPGAPAGEHSDLDLLVAAIRSAADLLGIIPPASPWLPALPDRVPPGDLHAPSDVLSLGLLDRPDRQSRETYGLDLAAGRHLLVAGGPRSGRTSALRAVAAAVAGRHGPEDAHLYVLDCAAGGLVGVEALPSCGAVVGRGDLARGERLLRRLAGEVARRQALLAGLGLGSLAEQRVSAPPGDRLPWMVLLVDSWEGMVQGYEGVDHGRPLDELTGLLRDGPAAGLCVVLTGGRSLLTARQAALVSERLLLRLADPADAALAGIPPRAVPAHQPPGRALVPGDPPLEVQLALVAPSDLVTVATASSAAAGARTSPESAPTTSANRSRSPLRVRALPSSVGLEGIEPPPEPGPLWTLLGVGGDELDPAGLDLAGQGPGALVAGPPGSGRSTALVAAACWHLGRGATVVVVTPRASPLRGLEGRPGVHGARDAGALQAAVDRADTSPLVVLVDDAEQLLDTDLDAALLAVLGEAPGRGWGMLVAGTTDELHATFRGLTVGVRRSRCGLLLCPAGPLDGDLLGIRTVRGLEHRPGRGVLAVRGRSIPVQVASPTAQPPLRGQPVPAGHGGQSMCG